MCARVSAERVPNCFFLFFLFFGFWPVARFNEKKKRAGRQEGRREEKSWNSWWSDKKGGGGGSRSVAGEDLFKFLFGGFRPLARALSQNVLFYFRRTHACTT